ncbi:hypothetical protein SAMN05421504_1011176 [Amycolatopsis xylanica]|uniref:Uncharacterized protein n=1 Tax=Amycolatopsis xylanica TaxID=589385 RepID=A0A1H2VBY0_9PSEU|nr:hypothetical protein SAMN05421504_1011176 [Amycolatopsis xylanica]
MTRGISLFVCWCSVVFTVGTALQNFVIVDLAMLEHTMRLAGAPPADAAGFLTGFRLVGWVFIVGNALGVLALTRRRWVLWLVVVVNLGQAAGVFAIRPVVFRAMYELYGPVGLLPSVVTDGGAVVLLVVLATWWVRARRRLPVG